jgi:hypothetical protein
MTLRTHFYVPGHCGFGMFFDNSGRNERLRRSLTRVVEAKAK